MLKTLIATPLGLALLAGVAIVGQSSSAAFAASKYTCMTDDGYGRKRPCSAGYMQKSANGSSYECFTDDGYGRKLPCSFRIKR